MLQCVLVWPVVESIRALQWRVCRLWRPQAAALAEQLAGRQGAGGAAAAQDASVARVAELEARQVLRPPGLGLPGVLIVSWPSSAFTSGPCWSDPQGFVRGQ